MLQDLYRRVNTLVDATPNNDDARTMGTNRQPHNPLGFLDLRFMDEKVNTMTESTTNELAKFMHLLWSPVRSGQVTRNQEDIEPVIQ